MDTRLRLVTYGKIEDLRAANESYHKVPLSDPRPAFGPLADDPASKIPFTYLGPGVFYRYENPEQTVGRVHLRLSPTHLNGVGIQDYPGGDDPNAMALSIARRFNVAANVMAQNVVFRNVVFQNGGETTLRLEGAVRNVTFDHCEVYGGRYGVRVGGSSASGIRFHDCTFDGGLASWTSRSDVKNEYEYYGPPECPVGSSGPPCLNTLGTKTNDILVIHGADQSEYVRCTFRGGHDGIQFRGDGLEIRDSLFEDLNDEVLQIHHGAANVKIHGNVIRQALNVISFALNPVGGPVFFYRNVVDQRVPTRGYRVLPPDAPSPWLWRYGADVKDQPTLEFHAYQNTFIESNDVDKSSYVSHLFYGDPSAPTTFRNNLYLAINVHRTLARVPAPASGAVAAGNIWYRYDVDVDPLAPVPLFVSATRRYFSLAELWADLPAWEANSQYADPQLVDFTPEHFEYETFYPGSDYRPRAGSPAEGHGVVLPATLPDDFSPGGAGPDVGARPLNAPPMAVGVDAATVFPAPGAPVAIASAAAPDTLDADGDGFEPVAFDGAASHDPDGTIADHVWSLAGRKVATTASPTLYLSEGSHYARLVVVDDEGQLDSDAVAVRVVPPHPGENRLVSPGFEEPFADWLVAGDVTRVKVRHSGVAGAQARSGGTLRQSVAVSPGLYTASGWIAAQSLTVAGGLLYTVRDENGFVLASGAVAKVLGTSPYTYYGSPVEVPEGGASLELTARGGGGGGLSRTLFDDLRVRDYNLLRNGRFEQRAPNGQEEESPGWGFVRGGTIVDDPAHVRSGRYALALAPYGNYHLIEQRIPHVSPSGYRVSAWLKTEGLSTAPTLNVRLRGAAGQNLGTRSVATTLSESGYTWVSRVLTSSDLPAGTASLTVEIRLETLPTGTAWFDDVMVEPIS
jgi:hypothetical protein